MRPPRFPVPASALLALAVALALVATAAARRQRHALPIVPAPVERVDEEMRRMYEAWKSEHGHGHGHGRPRDVSSDDRLRLEMFRDNLWYIDAHNAEADAGLHTFRLGLTPFADLTLEEYRGRVLGFRGRRGTSAARVGSGSTRYECPRLRGGDLPDAIDWGQLGASCHRGQESRTMRWVLGVLGGGGQRQHHFSSQEA